MRTLKPLAVGLALAAAACGVPEQKYKAALDETSKAIKEGEGQKQRAAACEAKLAEMEKAASSASADAASQRQLAAQLAKARAQLEQEKVAASLDAEQARKYSAQLEAEKTRLEQEKTALEKKSAEYEALASSLDGEIKAGRIQVSELQGKLTVRMAEKVLFPSGSATVSKEGKATLAKIADAFKDVKGRMIRVEGHTDNVPIKTERFPSNWELSSARAIAVVRIMQDRGIDPGLLGAAGYASYQPVAANDSADGRAQNRRIEISLAAPLSQVPTAAK